MVTLSIKNVSKKYNEKVNKHNKEVKIRKYLNELGFCNINKVGKFKRKYNLCFLLEVLHTGGSIEKVMFAYKHDNEYNYSKYNFHPDVIIGGKTFNHEIENAIYRFCEKYGKYLIQGYDIVDLALNDSNNFLNYHEYKKVKMINLH